MVERFHPYGGSYNTSIDRALATWMFKPCLWYPDHRRLDPIDRIWIEHSGMAAFHRDLTAHHRRGLGDRVGEVQSISRGGLVSSLRASDSLHSSYESVQDQLEDRDERVQTDLLYGMGASYCRQSSWSCVSFSQPPICDPSLICSDAYSFVIPTVYFFSRYRLPRSLQAKLVGIGLGIGFQGALGWYMVKSGLEQEIIDAKSVPRVSQYRLAAHLSAALALYVGMLHTALSLRRDLRHALLLHEGSSFNSVLETLSLPQVRRYRGVILLAGAMVFLTAVSGAFVAGLDAGLVYNEFPTMGGRLVPPTAELMDPRYAKKRDGSDGWWRNILENPVTAQFDHRLFVRSTQTLRGKRNS